MCVRVCVCVCVHVCPVDVFHHPEPYYAVAAMGKKVSFNDLTAGYIFPAVDGPSSNILHYMYCGIESICVRKVH